MTPIPKSLEKMLSELTVQELPRDYQRLILSKVDGMVPHSVLDEPEMRTALEHYSVGDLPHCVFKDILVGNSAEVLRSWESPYDLPDDVLSRLKLSAFDEVVEGEVPEHLEPTVERRRVRKNLVKALERGMRDFKQLPLVALPDTLYRRLDNWMGHDVVMPEELNEIHKRYRERRSEERAELRKKVMETKFPDLPSSVREQFDIGGLAESLCFYETDDLLRQHLGSAEHMARVFKVKFGYDLNAPGEDAERVSESLEEGWKVGYGEQGCDYLSQYLFSMSVREDWSLDWAEDEYVRKSIGTHGTRREGYRQRAREMLEGIADELQEPVDAIRARYGLEPLDLSK